MSELISNSTQRKQMLKQFILQLHAGEKPEQVKKQIATLLHKIPHGDVVAVEQELINEGLPEEEIVQLCDLHALVLEGSIGHEHDQPIPPGHPVATFTRENMKLLEVLETLHTLYSKPKTLPPLDLAEYVLTLRSRLNLLMDVDKHYRKKENLLFPYLEKHGITGPPKVMWAKHDEVRNLLKSLLEDLHDAKTLSSSEIERFIMNRLEPAAAAIRNMIKKEEEILFPMAMDTLGEAEWYEIYRQMPEIGFTLYDPQHEWHPKGLEPQETEPQDRGRIRLHSGSFSIEELTALLNTLPMDITFVGSDDKVKYFSQGEHRIFDRNRSVLQRDVRLCHPPGSVDVVEQILEDFKSGKASRAPFWIQMNGRFIHIEYFALRDTEGKYLGTLEVSQDVTEIQQLEGEQRLLTYPEK